MMCPCARCGAPGDQVPGYWLWLCPGHMARFRKNQAVNRRQKELHPYRGQVKTQNVRARELGAEGTFTEAEWLELIARYNERCVQCHCKVPLTIDHVVPLSKGGTNHIDNIQPLCGPCNYHKKTRTKDYR